MCFVNFSSEMSQTRLRPRVKKWMQKERGASGRNEKKKKTRNYNSRSVQGGSALQSGICVTWVVPVEVAFSGWDVQP